MWLKVGIPVIILLSLIAARLTYYVLWRRHWDKRPGKPRQRDNTEVIVLSDDKKWRS